MQIGWSSRVQFVKKGRGDQLVDKLEKSNVINNKGRVPKNMQIFNGTCYKEGGGLECH